MHNEYVDLSTVEGRGKFIGGDGRPKNLGDDGSNPTGTQPLIYMRFDPHESHGTNLGSLGNFSNSGVSKDYFAAIAYNASNNT